MKYPLFYGGTAGAIVVAIVFLVVSLDLPGHFETPWFGYLVMLVALSLIFTGVKRYRDVECGGVIRFSRALGLGLAMAVVAAVIYVVGWELFLAVTGRDFMADYTASMIDNMRADGASAAQIAATEAHMREFGLKYRDPLFRTPVTFAEIFPVGVLVAV
ncbi:MAG TPA: DUF4199 domain-containing protein, partial [Sphingomicrobium sp.]|nr:DUF4199 domain-containing protein [Sphingomicrobium sp.]